ncbi:MAG: hypothetical protein NZ929_00310 [Aigarchaeota archaeon]|nr:hypothetical protein [Aigarchaeota archaeon]MCX8193269.1 hypothetical protein [Nitrososphaeria archaeon]MDW7987049.1 hypothetical protein [Nitrososphaerota archaeon]
MCSVVTSIREVTATTVPVPLTIVTYVKETTTVAFTASKKESYRFC